MRLPESPERILQGVVADAIALGSDDQIRSLNLLEEGDQRGIAGLRRNVGVDQADG